MYDYCDLPTLVLNEIFGYLSVKQRIKCKSVCRTWMKEIELREEKNDTLILHLDPYHWNMKWSHTNNRGLMKFENSFQIKRLAFLKHPLTRSLLLQKTRKVAIVNFHRVLIDSETTKIGQFIGCFDECEEIEIRNFDLKGRTLTIDLPKLKTLAIRESPMDRLVLNCPSLEVLLYNWRVEKSIQFQGSARKLKRLTCYGWSARLSLEDKFESLQYLNLFSAANERVNDCLLELMPSLKRFVLYSDNPQADLANIRKQQKRCGLAKLEILFAGFINPVQIELIGVATGFVMIDRYVAELFDNYSKLVESSPWKFCMDYSALFSKFKILPASFFQRFDEPYSIEIGVVTSYMHLFEFLRHYPFVQNVRIHFSKVKANLILDWLHLLQPSLRELVIVEEHPQQILDIDLSFMRLFNLVFLALESALLPVEFIRKVTAIRSPRFFRGLDFLQLSAGARIKLYFGPQAVYLVDVRRSAQFRLSSVEEIISGLQADLELRKLLYAGK